MEQEHLIIGASCFILGILAMYIFNIIKNGLTDKNK